MLESDRSTGDVGYSVEVLNAHRHYGALRALDGVSLRVAAGEFVSLLGPSGSGKTTLLNVLAGFDALSDGDVFVNDKSMRGIPPHRRGLGMVFQSYALFPHMTVNDNVAYPLKIAGVDRAQREIRVAQALRMVELEREQFRLPDQLSGGQQQRVSLARAIIHRPKLLLMDEPLGALDRRLRQSLQFRIKEIHEQLGTTIIYVTHDQEEALAMSDRIAVMRGGKIEQMEAPAKLYQRPRTAFVASFLGDTNLIDVEIKSFGAEEAVVAFGDNILCIRGINRVEEQQAILSVRPEDWIIVESIGKGNSSIPVKVNTVLFMGASWRISCDAGLPKPIIISLPPDEWSDGEQKQTINVSVRKGAANLLMG